MPGSPRVLFVDIETAPIIAAVWTVYEANTVWIERDTYIMSFAARWMDEKKTKTYALPDYPLYRRDKHNDKALCKALHKLLCEADICVAHNGDAFDIKKINSRLMVHGFKPPTPYKTIDTLKIARRVSKFDSNKLDNLGRYLGEGRKIPNTGAALWRGCYNGDEKSWRIMRRYNAQDVDLLVRVYDRLKAWAPSHPDLRMYQAKFNPIACPTCESINTRRAGVHVKLKSKVQRHMCKDCGHWFLGAKIGQV